MHTFYLEGSAAVGEIALLPKEEAQHARKVLRLTAGDEVCLLDGQGGRYAGKIVEVGETVSAELIEALPDNESNIHLTVWQGVPKADKAEWIVQKLTELGVSDFELLNMTRCVVKGNEKDGLKKQERLNRIAREAVKQCRRGTVPAVGTPMSLKQAAKKMSACDLLLVPWEEAEGLTLAKAYEAYPDAKNIGIVIGPEGGISPEEIEVMKGYGAKPVTLGPRILRAETAAIASAAMVMTLWGDCK